MNATKRPPNPSPGTRRVDGDSRAEALKFLARLVGRTPTCVCWDSRHQLQGHAVVGGHELVVIAPRDCTHAPIVITAEDWDEIQHTPFDDRSALIRSRRITTRRQLRAALAA